MNITQEDIQKYAPVLRLTRHTGALLLWVQNTYIFRGEPESLKPKVVSVTIKNLIFGWWSIVSVFMNPVITIINWTNYKQYSREYARFIASPEQYIFEARHAEESGANKKDRQFKVVLTVGLIIAALVALVLIISILDSAQPQDL